MRSLEILSILGPISLVCPYALLTNHVAALRFNDFPISFFILKKIYYIRNQSIKSQINVQIVYISNTPNIYKIKIIIYTFIDTMN